MAVGVYLRRFVIDHLQKPQSVAADIAGLGRFTLRHDSVAALTDDANLYPKTIVFEPSTALASAVSMRPVGATQIIVRPFDWSRMQRLCRI